MNPNSNKEIKKEFYEHFLRSSIPSLRFGLFFTILLFIVFAVVTKTLFNSAPGQLFFFRFGMVLPLLLLTILVTYVKFFLKHLNTLFIIINLMMGVVIFLVGFTSNFSQPGYELYFAWVMLVIIGFFAFFRLRFHELILIGAFQLLSFAVTSIWNGSYSTDPLQVVNHLFFILSVFSIGTLMSYILQKINWRSFIHQKALASNYKRLLEESKERETAELGLRNAKLQLQDILNAIPDWIYAVDENKRFVILNSALDAEHKRQGFVEDCIGKKITRVYPLISKKTLEDIDLVFRTGQILINEQSFELIDKNIYAEIRKVPVFKDHKVVQVLTILRDRSRQQEINELKIKNSQQKEVMLREIHHRVKNNLAIVISVLSLQLKNNDNPELRRIILDIEMRIRSMALIHEHLYRSENLDRIPLAAYLRSLSSIISQTFSGKNIQIQSNLDETDVSIETALPIGLITNEILTNAYKYAFPENTQGLIEIILKRASGDNYILTIRDNGIGLPSGFKIDNSKSLGMFIVKLLIEQLNGKIEIVIREGSAFIIQFCNPVVNKPNINII